MTIPNADHIGLMLNVLQDHIHDMNELKGFHDDRPQQRDFLAERGYDFDAYNTNLAQWQGNKLLLIVSEVVEAHDEIRNGRAANETYYPTARPNEDGTWAEWGTFKPEGVPSEIADTVIRCFDFAGTEGFDLGAIILEKLAYNSTRGYKHGKQF